MQIQDLTLREGAQRSDRSYSVEQKVEATRILDSLGVEYVQLGFPVAGDGTGAACERLDVDAKLVGMARAVERDVDAAVDAGVDVVEFGVPASDVQREAILGIDRDEVVDLAASTYEYVQDRGVEVHVAAMDSFRADPALVDELSRAVDAPMFTLLDTVGIATPDAVDDVVAGLDRDPETVGVHFHQDLGLATANVLAAAAHDVGKADVTVGGIGERAGNTPLEEVVVAGTIGGRAIEFGVNAAELVPRCREVLAVLDEPIPPHKPVLGRTAFEHESGMHTATMLDRPSVYEAFDPACFGGERSLRFGPSSGRGAARRLLERAGQPEPSGDAVAAFLDRLHALDDHVDFERAIEMAEEEIAN